MQHTFVGTEAPEGRFWFALQVKSRQENVVAMALRNTGFEEFLPLYQSRRRWSTRVKVLSLPLFPGYVFCRFALAQKARVLDTPGVWGVVYGKRPIPIDEAEIAALQAVMRSRVSGEPWPFLSRGARVRIAEGPLAGLDGIFVATKEGHRIVLSVSLLQRSVAVEVDHSWIERMEEAA